MTSRYIAIYEGEAPERVPLHDFHLWTKCTNRDETLKMAVRCHLRHRGGVTEPLTLHLFEFEDKSPRHPNGQPMCVQNQVLTVSPLHKD